MATVAVFIALGSGAYAAIHLPKNSVGTKQLKKGSVTGVKVRNGSLTRADLKAGTVPSTSPGSNGHPSHEGWHEVGAPGEPPFRNGWKITDSSSPTLAFYEDGEGVVHLRGTVTGPSHEIMFCGCTEPMNIVGPNSELAAEYQGAVLPPAGTDSLDGVSFPAEA